MQISAIIHSVAIGPLVENVLQQVLPNAEKYLFKKNLVLGAAMYFPL